MSLSDFSTASQDAAILLMKVRRIAIDEVGRVPLKRYCTEPFPADSSMISCTIDNTSITGERFVPSVIKTSSLQKIRTLPSNRLRTVSLSFGSDFDLTQDIPSTECVAFPRISITDSFSIREKKSIRRNDPDSIQRLNIVQSSSEASFSSASSFDNVQGALTREEIAKQDKCLADSPASQKDSVELESSLYANDSSEPSIVKSHSKLVGTHLAGSQKVRGTLRKKFSWKSFPELERYLIDNRVQYLQYSNQLNYTAEQKRYNNSLTHGLLDLATSEGYVFEGFTFAAVRDRIRCYYKSYVQATKKKVTIKRRFSK